MSETAPKSIYSTAAGIAIFVGSSCASACELDTGWTTGHVVRGELELDANGEQVFDAEMAAWASASDRALLNCDAWE